MPLLCLHNTCLTCAHDGFRLFSRLALFGKWLATLALVMDMARQLAWAQTGLYLLAPIHGIGQEARTGVGPHQQMIHCLAVMQSRISDMITADQLV